MAGVFRIAIEPRPDERGFFARTFCEREFAAHGLATRFPQDNLSRNRAPRTLRGMHFQVAPHEEVKVVRCATGAVYDVAVDLRRGSPSFGAWVGVELSAERGDALYIPGGCAHGFLTLEPDTDVVYQMGAFHEPGAGRGFRWNDPAFAIEWPMRPEVLSDRDATYPDFTAALLDG